MTKIENKKIAFLDRDGTIIVDKVYLADPKQIEFLPRAAEGLRALIANGWTLIIVSNQSGIARKYFSLADYERVIARLREMLADENIPIAGAYFCPHAAQDNCACRKPKIGQVEQAGRELNFDWRQCVCAVIGDKLSDIELGKNIGAKKTVFIRNQMYPSPESSPDCVPDAIVDDLFAAAEILNSIKN